MRQCYAMKAMQSLVNPFSGNNAKAIAVEAFKIANAMIEEEEIDTENREKLRRKTVRLQNIQFPQTKITKYRK